MNCKIRIYVFGFWTLIFLGIAAFGQSAKLDFNLDHLAKKAVETVNITLDSSMLGLVAPKFMKGTNQDQTKKLIEGLSGIWVRSFEFKEEGAYSQSEVDDIRKQLAAPGWSCIVKVEKKKEPAETADICLRKEGEKILGLAILVAEPKELTLVNIVGSISPDQLPELQGMFGIPEMGLGKKKIQRPKPADYKKGKNPD